MSECRCPERDERLRWIIRSVDCPLHGPEIRAEIDAAHAEHPRDKCDLHVKPFGRCTCDGQSVVSAQFADAPKSDRVVRHRTRNPRGERK